MSVNRKRWATPPPDCFCLFLTERLVCLSPRAVCAITKDRCRKDFDGDMWTDSQWCLQRWGLTRCCPHRWARLYELVDVPAWRQAPCWAGQRQQNKRLKMKREERQPITKMRRAGGALSHLMKSLELFHFAFISTVFFSVAFLLWNSVITLILKFKYMDFYLCISILVWMSVVYECTWGNLTCVTRLYEVLGSVCGCKILKNGARQECSWALFSSETFWFLPSSVLWLVLSRCQMKFSSVWIKTKNN